MTYGVIFDMDGVLVDSEVHWKQVESEFLGGLIPGWSPEDQRSILGMSAYDVHALLVDRYGATLTRDEYVSYYSKMSRTIYGERSRLLDGAVESLASFRREGIPLALASSSPHDWINIVLERFELREYFNQIVSSDDVEGKGKPAPDIYLLTATKLGLAAANCVAVEDSTKGVASAKAAEMRCIGYRNGFNEHQLLDAADCIVSDLSRIAPLMIAGLFPVRT